MTALFIFCMVLAALCAACVLARSGQKGGLRPADTKRRVQGFCVMERGIFRLHYATSGPHAVVRHCGGDDGECPARVEDAARQLELARHVLCDRAGFRSPLAGPFFPHLRSINVYFFNRASLNGFNGLSFSMPSPLMDPDDPKGSAGIIHLANDLPPDNLTPAHEFFHQIQNASTRMKNLWFFEGMARWSQSLFDTRPEPGDPSTADPEYDPQWLLDDLYAAAAERPPSPAPWSTAWDSAVSISGLWEDPEALDALLRSSYDAAFLLWFPLTDSCLEDSIMLPHDDPALRAVYSDGTPVLRTQVLHGTRMMRTVLEELEEAEIASYRENGYQGPWTEALRRSPGNNRYILDVVRQTAARFCP